MKFSYNKFKSTQSKAEESVDTRKTIIKLILKLYCNSGRDRLGSKTPHVMPHVKIIASSAILALHFIARSHLFRFQPRQRELMVHTSSLLCPSPYIGSTLVILYTLLGSMGQYGQNTDLYTQK
ncbi:hypothetical protein T05_904 [Trichinella murrelli]|uniref:Uncharacterized protein n=1 Tax=Trichinella murrelli TaxID=144512 RepID=A0A0V0TFL8_9BILA|nr:hypothetical protein T05_904 [Trichinella murrelli]